VLGVLPDRRFVHSLNLQAIANLAVGAVEDGEVCAVINNLNPKTAVAQGQFVYAVVGSGSILPVDSKYRAVPLKAVFYYIELNHPGFVGRSHKPSQDSWASIGRLNCVS
jgi:hypothetical protein